MGGAAAGTGAVAGAAKSSGQSAPASVTGYPPVASLPPPRSWDEYKVHAALRLVEANPGRTYLGKVPEPLFGIPVLEIELERDGRIHRIKVLREPSDDDAKDTVQLAIDAVKRGAPYGDASKFPKPWKFVEVFLFDENRRFKPRTLDL